MKQGQTNVDETGLWETIIRAEAHSLAIYQSCMQKAYGNQLVQDQGYVDDSFYYTYLCISE